MFSKKKEGVKKALMPSFLGHSIVTRQKRHDNENGNNCKLLSSPYILFTIFTRVYRPLCFKSTAMFATNRFESTRIEMKYLRRNYAVQTKCNDDNTQRLSSNRR